MPNVERDTIIDAECVQEFGARGILLKVDWKKRFTLSRNEGLIWLDAGSASGLSLAPPNPDSIADDKITAWCKENLNGKPIEFVSFIESGLTPELRQDYNRIFGMLRRLNPKLVRNLDELIKAAQSKESHALEKHLEVLSFFSELSSLAMRGNANVVSINGFIDEFMKFSSKLMAHFSWPYELIIPRLGELPTPDEEIRVTNRISCRTIGQSKICFISNIGYKKDNRVIKKAIVFISDGNG